MTQGIDESRGINNIVKSLSLFTFEGSNSFHSLASFSYMFSLSSREESTYICIQYSYIKHFENLINSVI